MITIAQILEDEKLKHFVVPEENTPVAKLDVKAAFETLQPREKLYAHFISEASWAGAPIVLEQTSEESLAIFHMLQSTFRSYLQGRDTQEQRAEFWESKRQDKRFQAVVQYAVNIYGNMGNYKSFGDTKFIPRLEMSEFEAVVRESGSTEALSLFDQVKERMYSLREEDLELRFGNSAYYSPNVTREDAELVNEFMEQQKLSPYNTRLFKCKDSGHFELILAATKVGTTGTHEYKGKRITIKTGDYTERLALVRDNLKRAAEYAANDHQRLMMESYVKHFDEGDINDHMDAQRHWIKDIGPSVECNIGFVESYRDPLGVRGEFEGFAAIVNKETSRKFGALVSAAESFIAELPWNKNDANPGKTPFEVDVFRKPDFTALEVLGFSTSGVPAGINIPNYSEIRENEGFKNVSLSNVLSSMPEEEKVTFLADSDQELFQKYRGKSFEVQVGAHELTGHGSLKLLIVNDDGTANFDAENTIDPITGKKVDSWYKAGESYPSRFTDIASTFEECRAECVGIYLSTYAELLKIFGFEGQEADDVMYINWLNMVRAGLLALEFYQPDTDTHGQAHMQARFVILRVLLEASKENGFVKLQKDEHGDLVVTLDRDQIQTVGKQAIFDFLLKLGVYKSIGDVDRGSALYAQYSAVDSEFLTIRKEVLDKKKPRRQFVQCMTKLSTNNDRSEESVELIEFDATAEGLIESFLARF